MLRNYLKVAWRNLVKNKGYSFINIGGLAIGMTVAIFIGLWVYDELSFNKYHKNYDSIAQVWGGGTNPQTSEIEGSYTLQYALGAVIKNNYPHYFKHAAMSTFPGDFSVSSSDKIFISRGQFMEEDGPAILSLQMLAGSHSSLHDPESIILSRSVAESIFGKNDPINKTLKIDNRIDAKVTGIYEDIPANSQFAQVKFFGAWQLLIELRNLQRNIVDDWDNRTINIYVQLQPTYP